MINDSMSLSRAERPLGLGHIQLPVCEIVAPPDRRKQATKAQRAARATPVNRERVSKVWLSRMPVNQHSPHKAVRERLTHMASTMEDHDGNQ